MTPKNNKLINSPHKKKKKQLGLSVSLKKVKIQTGPDLDPLE